MKDEGCDHKRAHAPPLVHDFDHAIIERAVVGPRREVTLVVLPLVWEGQNGTRACSMDVRFGGIKNLAEVSAFLAGVSDKG